MLEEIYFDHASTSCPKPSIVIEEIENYFNNISVSPGRSSYKKAIAAEEMIFQARSLCAQLIKAEYPDQIIFTLNSTHALNIAIKGSLSFGDHVITTNYEHNAVLRPLETLKEAGVITYDIVESDVLGKFDISDFEKNIKDKTRAIIVNHGSNVLGSLMPIETIGHIAKKYGLLFIVDASQTVGFIDIDVNKHNIDLLAFTGHKSLLGPSGTGGLYVRDAERLRTLYEGGTGANSISLLQPETLPAKFEAGTINYLGIAGLLGALNYLNNQCMEEVREEKIAITEYCLSTLKEMPEVVVYGDISNKKELPIISFNVKNISPQEISYLLDKESNIMLRSGLQCAPLIHKTLNTYPHGTIRVSFGYKNSIEQVDIFTCTLKKIISDHYENISAKNMIFSNARIVK